MSKEKKRKIKKEQANMQSDKLEMNNWIPSDGITMMGTATVDSLDPGMDL